MELIVIEAHWYAPVVANNGEAFRGIIWPVLPIVVFMVACALICISEWRVWRADRTAPCDRLAPEKYERTDLPPYPVDLISELNVPHGVLDQAGIPYNAPFAGNPACYQPTTIAQYALARWNAYLRTGEVEHMQAFMSQANWFVEHEVRFEDSVSGWPLTQDIPAFYASGPWLSGLTQGNALSVLVRAYQLTGNDDFLAVARRAIRTFERDIADGGVAVTIGEGGIFFEEVAVYPAAHILNGFLFGLFGLYDYISVIPDERIASLIERSLTTLHSLIDAFDLGYWSRYDLLKRHHATHFYHDLHIVQIKALVRYSGCKHCAAKAAQWEQYQRSRSCRLKYFIASRIARYRRGCKRLFSGRATAKPGTSLLTQRMIGTEVFTTNVEK